jgi:predicted Zn-dependent protease
VGAHTSPYDEAIARALQLLPRQPEKIVLVERPNATHRHEGTPNVEAFVMHGSRVVYVVRQGVTLQGALKGRGIFDYALAAIIWHEMAHIDGADEPAAQRAEEQLWKEFILARRVDSRQGMKYLALLRNRR